MPECRDCGQAKPDSEFYFRWGRPRSRCKPCYNRYYKKPPAEPKPREYAEAWLEIHSIWLSAPMFDATDAACVGTDPDSFVGDGDNKAAARKTCLSCPLVIQCAMYGQTNRMHGMWGGLDLRDNRRY